MMVDLPRFGATLDAASQVGLPVWVGFSVGPELGHDVELLDDDIELRDGGRLADAVAVAAANESVDALCTMHTDVRLAERCVEAIRADWTGPLGVYAHAAGTIDGEFTHDGVIEPDEYVALVPGWRRAGATMVGGCCGIGPDHLRLVAEEIAQA